MRLFQNGLAKMATNKRWAREQLNELLSLGIPFQEATETISYILDRTPPESDPSEFLPTTPPIDNVKDTETARIQWHESSPERFRYLLDAIGEPES